MGSIRSATNTSLWTLECETRTYATALEKFSATQQGHQLLITHADGGDFSLTAGTESKGDSPFMRLMDLRCGCSALSAQVRMITTLSLRLQITSRGEKVIGMKV